MWKKLSSDRLPLPTQLVTDFDMNQIFESCVRYSKMVE